MGEQHTEGCGALSRPLLSHLTSEDSSDSQSLPLTLSNRHKVEEEFTTPLPTGMQRPELELNKTQTRPRQTDKCALTAMAAKGLEMVSTRGGKSTCPCE